jgi:cytoskeletal protein CcmA (bactofilin family)
MTSLAIIPQPADAEPDSTPGGNMRLVHGVSSGSAPTASVTDAVRESGNSASAPIRPLQQQVPISADMEHLVSQFDSEKVVLIPAGVTFTGDIETKGLASLVISGTVIGMVDAGSASVIVQETGSVVGTIKADDTIAIAGTVKAGEGAMAVITGGLWILAEKGCVRGDVAYARHRAYEGAVFRGQAIPFAEYKA